MGQRTRGGEPSSQDKTITDHMGQRTRGGEQVLKIKQSQITWGRGPVETTRGGEQVLKIKQSQITWGRGPLVSLDLVCIKLTAPRIGMCCAADRYVPCPQPPETASVHLSCPLIH
ncbi:hypothetical protein RRG08_019481 [Elysia crispata]|uniref:Uncharacterized protein n=1 Tax=Elysia crispata TaxID=231223 RepID=A0AAE1CZT4_9GAST|nr:hypothetical protein RRG08_019481 [Elysia crispata]